MLKYLLAFLLVTNALASFSQSYEKEYEAQFAWEVKQINEFIERFNNSDTTLIKQYYQKHDPSKILTREKLIKSLFNAQRKDWNFADIQSFIKTADNKEHPAYLDFFKDNWYAKVNCAVNWKGRAENAVLTLTLKKLPNNTFKWVIASANTSFLADVNVGDKAQSIIKIPAPTDNTTALNPMSHATDFMGIDKVSSDKVNIANYFQDQDKCTPETQQFIHECFNGHLKILRANTVTYNFMQIKGWNIEIQQFNRPDKNSGWLISKLTKTFSD